MGGSAYGNGVPRRPGGVGLLRDSDRVEKVKYAAVGWIGLLGSSVAGMAITKQASDDPAATVVNTIAFTPFAAIGIAIAVAAYRPLFRRSEQMS